MVTSLLRLGAGAPSAALVLRTGCGARAATLRGSPYLRCALDLPHHLAFGLGQQGLFVFFVIAPEDEPDDDRQCQQGPADGSRDPAYIYAFAEQVTAGSEYRSPRNSAGRVEDKEAPGREPVRSRQQRGKGTQQRNETPKNTIDPP
jgi:hypothetical protein